MTKNDIKKYIIEKLHWIEIGTEPADLEKYCEIVDDFQSMLINNPPKELL